MLDRTRQYFREQDVIEVETPMLTSGTATDPNINSMTVTTGDGEQYLHTSPEHFMKRLLAAGYPDIFQVCRVFRAGEAGIRHLPEFTMIEWYRLGFALEDIIADTIGLTGRLLAGTTLGEATSLTYSDAFTDTLSVDPFEATSHELAEVLDADDELRTALGDDRDAWLDLAMATRVSPAFSRERLTIVHHYPASQAALARLTPDDPRTADRFELFLGPVELANGFVELQDADEQLSRFEDDRRRRRLAGQAVPEVDESLIAALRAGLPDCAGVAMGLDRLLMIDEGLDDISQTMTFMPGS
jgi:lysyl-tRNA synthetase class 2